MKAKYLISLTHLMLLVSFYDPDLQLIKGFIFSRGKEKDQRHKMG